MKARVCPYMGRALNGGKQMDKRIELLIACEKLRIAIHNESACARYAEAYTRNREAWKDMLECSSRNGGRKNAVRN